MAAAAASRLKLRASRSSNDLAHPDLLQKFLDASKDSPQVLDTSGIIGMLMSTISGAGDTSATTMTAAIFYLLKHPHSLKKLEEELSQADLPEIPTVSQISKLPYLNAVIRETMRVFPTPTAPMERLVPQGGVTIAGMFFPMGTSVGCMPSAVHQRVDVFGEDVNTFRPERWLISDREQLRCMEATHMGFSRGRRVCLGQNIAVLQMKKSLSALLMKFKVSPFRGLALY